jgi:hypothetical protein
MKKEKIQKTPYEFKDFVIFAKEKYCELSEDGERKHKFSEIVKMIEEKFHKKITTANITKWKKLYEWDIHLRKIKSMGLAKATGSVTSCDAEIYDTESEVIAKLYAYNLGIVDMMYDVIYNNYQNKEHGIITMAEATAAYNQAHTNTLKIMGLQENINIENLESQIPKIKEIIFVE